MGLFSPYKDKDAPSAATKAEQATTQKAEPATIVVPKPAGKAAPTPKRRDAEAARRERLNPQLSPKESRRRARLEASAANRRRQEEQEANPARALMRRWVDSRFNVAEWSMPVLMTLLVVTLLITPVMPGLVAPITYATWAFMALIVVDIWRMWRGYKKLAAQRIPNEPLKGILYYGFNRAITFRRMRMPRVELKRGDTV